MKNLLVLLLLLSLTFAGKSQSTYHPFPTNYGNWTYEYYDDFHNPTGFTANYRLTGDTIMGGINYKRIIGQSTGMTGGFGGPGGIREDNKIIYYRPDTSLNEYVLYNFNLNVGDTVIHPYGGAYCTNDTITVLQVDSLLGTDGYHKRWLFSYNVNWIEGIGASYYLLAPANVLCVSGNDVLQCMVGDSGFAYPQLNSFCVVGTQNLLTVDQDLTFSYSPSSQTITITAPSLKEKNYSLRVFDMMGNLLYQEQSTLTSSQFSKTLSLPTFSQGMYIVNLQTDKEAMAGKVVR